MPRGEGLEVVRRGTKRGHTYHLLAADRGPRRAFEPFLVTLNDKSEVFPGFEHPGTEFIYLLEGSLTYRHGDETHLLKAGDALTFAGTVPHGPEKLLKTPIRMLSIIIYADGTRRSRVNRMTCRKLRYAPQRRRLQRINLTLGVLGGRT